MKQWIRHSKDEVKGPHTCPDFQRYFHLIYVKTT